MAQIVTRAGKGTELDHAEGDANFININTELVAATATITTINASLNPQLVTGEWKKVPSLIRLRLAGTGTCVVDSQNALGAISTVLYTYTAASATNQIEYPYLGDDAVYIRVTLTGTCTAEVL